LEQNSLGHVRETAEALADLPNDLYLRDVRFSGETSVYGAVRVHRRTELVMVGNDGSERIVRLFGSTIEQDGRFKVFSYVVD
jgi:hypothetical protein